MKKNVVSSPECFSPEMVRAHYGKQFFTEVDAEAQDIWAVGSIFLRIVTGMYWFGDLEMEGLRDEAMMRHEEWVRFLPQYLPVSQTGFALQVSFLP